MVDASQLFILVNNIKTIQVSVKSNRFLLINEYENTYIKIIIFKFIVYPFRLTSETDVTILEDTCSDRYLRYQR